LIPAHIHTVIADRLLDLDDVRAAASLRPDAVIAGAAMLEQPGGTDLLRQILNPSL
jgi:hypothetical protein